MSNARETLDALFLEEGAVDSVKNAYRGARNAYRGAKDWVNDMSTDYSGQRSVGTFAGNVVSHPAVAGPAVAAAMTGAVWAGWNKDHPPVEHAVVVSKKVIPAYTTTQTIGKSSFPIFHPEEYMIGLRGPRQDNEKTVDFGAMVDKEEFDSVSVGDQLHGQPGKHADFGHAPKEERTIR